MSTSSQTANSSARPARKRRRKSAWLQTSQQAWQFRRTKVGMVLVLLVAAIALGGPFLNIRSPDDFLGLPYQLPSADAYLGTDALGRDVLARTLNGGVSVLVLSATSTLIGVAVGAILGVISGITKPLIDQLIMRALDVLLAFPQLVLVLLFVSAFGSSLWLIIVAVALTHVPRVARVARGATLEVKEYDFIKSVEVLGIPKWRIATGEIVPAISGPLLVETGLRMTWSVALVASVGFLGLGLQPPAVDWGLMINENRIGIASQPFAVFAPVLLVALLAVGVNLITDGLLSAILGDDSEAKS